MKYRKIGKTNIEVSEISLGCWTMGGLNWVNGTPNGWADVNEKEIAEAINYAIDKGVTHFDNADVYGNGRAERMLSRILGNRSKNFIISSKIGWFPGTAEHAYEPAHIRHQCEQSLINLKRDYIDIYYFHHANYGENYKYVDDAVEAMYRLKEEGKIRVIGQCAKDDEEYAYLIPKVKPEVIQSSSSALNDYLLPEETKTRELIEKNKISYVAYSPLAQGLLLDKYNKNNPPKFDDGDHRKNAKRFSVENLTKLEPKLEKLKNKFGSSVDDLSRMALQYLLHYKVVGAVIPGFRNLKQVKANLAQADNPLSDDEFNFIKDIFKDYNKPF